MQINSWKSADAFLGSKATRRMPGIRSTSITRHEYAGTISVRYHGTDVVTYRQDGTCLLNSGGYRSATTKARINEFSPARLYQKDFSWFVIDTPADQPFSDGLIVDTLGYPVEKNS